MVQTYHQLCVWCPCQVIKALESSLNSVAGVTVVVSHHRIVSPFAGRMSNQQQREYQCCWLSIKHVHLWHVSELSDMLYSTEQVRYDLSTCGLRFRYSLFALRIDQLFSSVIMRVWISACVSNCKSNEWMEMKAHGCTRGMFKWRSPMGGKHDKLSG